MLKLVYIFGLYLSCIMTRNYIVIPIVLLLMLLSPWLCTPPDFIYNARQLELAGI